MAKPTGTIGAFSASVSAEGLVAGKQDRIVWPVDQKEIESKILHYFIREMERTGASISAAESGGTEDLDFLLTLPGGKAYLELMEAVAPLLGDIPFRAGAQRHDCLDYADIVFKLVQKKIDKYGFRHEIPIHLLLYVTHEQYAPGDMGIAALRRFFLDRRHPFEYVFFLRPLAEDLVLLHVIANRDHPLRAPTLAELAGQFWLNLPASGFRVEQVKDGKMVANSGETETDG